MRHLLTAIILLSVTLGSLPADAISNSKYNATVSYYKAKLAAYKRAYLKERDKALQLGAVPKVKPWKPSTWPSNRFKHFSDGTTYDRVTGLHWMDLAGCVAPERVISGTSQHPTGGFPTFHFARIDPLPEALEQLSEVNDGFRNCAGYTGQHSDWRLATLHELTTLLDYREDGKNIPGIDTYGGGACENATLGADNWTCILAAQENTLWGCSPWPKLITTSTQVPYAHEDHAEPFWYFHIEMSSGVVLASRLTDTSYLRCGQSEHPPSDEEGLPPPYNYWLVRR